MDDFEWKAICRLPLAKSVILLFDHICNPVFLPAVFQKYKGRSYERELQFPTFLFIISDALLQHHGSGHESMKRFADNGDLNVSMEAVYGKLRRAPITLSCGLLAECTNRLAELTPSRSGKLPESLKHFQMIVVDGKKIKNVAKRLAPLRKIKGAVLGGKVLAALSLNNGMVVSISADADGEANDTPLVPALLESVKEAIKGTKLFILDAQFCDLTQPPLLSAGGNHFLVRYHPKVSFHRDKTAKIRRGKDRQGRKYLEEWGYIGAEGNKKRRYVRRITLRRSGEENIILVTDLLDADVHPAIDLLDAYLMRWGIEVVFQKITDIFHLDSLIASTPEGTIFQCAFCMLLYNMMELIRQYVAFTAVRDLEEISMSSFCYDVDRQLVAWSEMVGPTLTVDYFELNLSSNEMREELIGLLNNVWTDLWKKSPKKRNPKKKPMTKQYIKGGHTSVARVLKNTQEHPI